MYAQAGGDLRLSAGCLPLGGPRPSRFSCRLPADQLSPVRKAWGFALCVFHMSPIPSRSWRFSDRDFPLLPGEQFGEGQGRREVGPPGRSNRVPPG